MRNLIRLKMALVFSLLVSSLATAQTASNVVCSGCVGTGDMANAAVTTGKIADGAVQAIDMADGVVTTQKIKDLTIGANDLANGSVTTGKIRDGAVAFVDLSPQVMDHLGGAITNITMLWTPSADTSVVSAACPSDRIPVSASCDCDSENGTRNIGVLNACYIEGNGAVAACYPEAVTYDPFLPAPLAVVAPVCLGAMSADGTPWLPMSTGLTSTGTGSQASKMMTSEAEAQWHKEQQDALEAALSKLQNERDIYNRRLSERQR